MKHIKPDLMPLSSGSGSLRTTSLRNVRNCFPVKTA